jgi:hypothetical protein
MRLATPARAGTLVAAVVAAALAVGCGGEEDSEAPETTAALPSDAALTRAEQRTLAHSEQAIQAYCIRVGQAAGGGRELPSVAAQERAFESLEDLIGVVTTKPAAEVQPGVDARLLLGDLAENLEGSNCDPRLVERIDAALGAIASG